LWFENGGRHLAGGQQRVQVIDGRFGSLAKFGGELDDASLLALGMKHGTAGDRDVHHFFEAKGLGTQLYIVVIPSPELSPFVLDRKRDGGGGAAASSRAWSPFEFNDIGTPIKAKPPRGDPQAAFGSDPLAAFEPGPIGSCMKLIAAPGMLIVNIKAIQMSERGAAIAIQECIQGG
jgi:hypothetical protein